MNLRSLIGKLQSPSFQTVVAIADYAGSGMVVERHQSIRVPAGTVQVWEFIPQFPPLDREPKVVAVLICKHRLQTWTPLDLQFAEAVAYYEQQAEATWAKARAESADAGSVNGGPTPPAPTPTLVLPSLPAGLRITSTGRPLTLGGKPVVVAVAAAGGEP